MPLDNVRWWIQEDVTSVAFDKKKNLFLIIVYQILIRPLLSLYLIFTITPIFLAPDVCLHRLHIQVKYLYYDII